MESRHVRGKSVTEERWIVRFVSPARGLFGGWRLRSTRRAWLPKPSHLSPRRAAGCPAKPPGRAPDDATSETVAAVRRADQRVRGGFSRAARGAYFSARTEFVAALRTIAEAYDVQQQTAIHGRSLDAGLIALAEADELARLGSSISAADLKRLVAAHQTALLKEADFAVLTPAAVAERYGAFAEQQLAVAAAGEPAGSMALVGLAKVAQVAVAGERRLWSESILAAATFYRDGPHFQRKQLLRCQRAGRAVGPTRPV